MDQQSLKWSYKKESEYVEGDFDDSKASIIVKVASNSPAEIIGLKEGDYVISINNEPMMSQVDLDISSELEKTQYSFYSKDSHSYINIEIDSLPLGIHAEPSTKNILINQKNGDFAGWDVFRVLWKRRDWDALLQASKTRYLDNTAARIIRKVFKNYFENAGMLYRGVAEYELGNEEYGIDLISRFVNKHLYSYETYEHAIAFFYIAKWSELIGEKDDMEHWLSEADRSNGGAFERITQEVYLKGLEPCPSRYQWKGEKFPGDELLVKLDSTGTVSINSYLSDMNKDELLPVCVMPAYRGNGPYNEALGCYASIYKYISGRLLPLEVIVDTTEKVKGEEWRYSNEDYIKENNIGIELLFDEDSVISETLELEFSPAFFILNNEGTIVYQGSLRHGFDYWEALGTSQ